MPSAISTLAVTALSRSFRTVGILIETPRRHQRIIDLLVLNDHLLRDVGLTRNDLRYGLPLGPDEAERRTSEPPCRRKWAHSGRPAWPSRYQFISRGEKSTPR